MSYVKYKLYYRFSDDGEFVPVNTFKNLNLETALRIIKEFFIDYGGASINRLKLTKNDEEIDLTKYEPLFNNIL